MAPAQLLPSADRRRSLYKQISGCSPQSMSVMLREKAHGSLEMVSLGQGVSLMVGKSWQHNFCSSTTIYLAQPSIYLQGREGREVVAAQNEARRMAVIGLKDNLARVREEVAHKAALYRQLQKQKQEVQDKEFQDLIERGLNPYEIHRKKDMEAQAAAELFRLSRMLELIINEQSEQLWWMQPCRSSS
eukprot:scaffold20972_cov20-Tisochrysis_lutea.AAC.4